MQSVEFVLFFLQLYISCFRLVLRFLCNFCELLCRHSTTLRSHQQITWCQWPSSQFEWEPQRTYRSKMIQAMQQRITFFTKLFLLSYGRDRRMYRELTVLPHQCGCTPPRFVKIPATSSARVCTLEHQFLYSSLSSLSCNMSCCTLQALRPSCTLHLGPSALFVQVANAIECWHCRCWGPMVLC